LQFLKFPLMSMVINGREIYTVKALQAAGVPLPFWSLPGTPPTGIGRWMRRALVPFGQHSFQPYGPSIIQSRAMTQFLLEKGVDVNIRLVLHGGWAPPGIGDVSMTPLHVALTDRWPETARLLIAHGADVYARDSIGRSPLTVAITYCPSAIELLLASGVDINEQTRFGPPLLAAARYQWLYPRVRHVQERENAVKILLEKGADPNTRDSAGRNALMVMSMEHRPGDPGEQFALVRRVSSVESAAKIIMNGNVIIDVDVEPNKALQLIGEALLQAGSDIDAADSNGRTPLMYAVRYQRPTAVRLLLEHGANKKLKDKSGLTALDLAKQFGSKEIINYLTVAEKAKPTVKSKTVR
jgi:ankyrin repeat protein